jgi:hypothetical protein
MGNMSTSPERFPSQAFANDEFTEENELLRLSRFEPEYGTEESDTPGREPAIEYQWLKRIQNFEEQYKGAKRVKVYDFLGRPAFKKMEELKPQEIEAELDRFQSLMEEKKMALDCSSDYDKAIIYKFVTEELFEQEIDDVSADGVVTHFVYEEFHPNHELDLRKYADELIGILFWKKWDKFDSHCFALSVGFKGSEYDPASVGDIIQAFQETHGSFSVQQFQIQDVKFDLVKGRAEVKALIRYVVHGNEILTFDGDCVINFLYQWGFWYICGFRLPGFGD